MAQTTICNLQIFVTYYQQLLYYILYSVSEYNTKLASKVTSRIQNLVHR